jgi:hypothetical protein
MRFLLMITMVGLAGFAITTPTCAQSRRPMAADEFIQSSSQLKTGERLVGRTAPGSESQQIMTLGMLPTDNSKQGPTSTDRVSAQRPEQYNSYPYPVPIQPAAVTPRLRQTAFQAVGNPIRTAQNCNCGPPTVGGFQVPASTVPSIQSAPLPEPQGRLFVPGTAVNGQAVIPPAFQLPQSTYGQQITVPVYSTIPMPAGTYLGRGIVGQPTAFVSGQKVRNLLRFIFP